MLKKHVTPKVQKICIFGAISLNKIFIKICSHPKNLLIFFVTPLFILKKFCDPQLFYAPPHDSPLM